MKIYCINLDKRTDRWVDVSLQFKKLGLPIERFSAVNHATGHKGCIMSHYQLLSKVKNNLPFMIVEDDVLFLPDALKTLDLAMSQLPNDWDMLYLGATLNEPLERYSDNLFKLKNGWTTHAIIYNSLDVIYYTLSNLMNAKKIDVFMTEVQDKYNCFITYPMVATQRPGHSNIIKKFTDYSAIEERYNKYTNERENSISNNDL